MNRRFSPTATVRRQQVAELSVILDGAFSLDGDGGTLLERLLVYLKGDPSVAYDKSCSEVRCKLALPLPRGSTAPGLPIVCVSSSH